MMQFCGDGAIAPLYRWPHPRLASLAELQDNAQLMACILKVSTMKLAGVINDQNFWNSIWIPIVLDARVFPPHISLWPDRMLETFHHRKVTRRTEADIKPEDHLRIDTNHPC